MKRCLVTLLVGAIATMALADVIITEVMYDPSTAEPANEWVEMFNNGSAIDLQNWDLDDLAGGGGGAANITSASTTWGSGQILILSSLTKAAFETEWGSLAASVLFIDIEGSWPSLNNTGDWVNLLDDSDVVQYAVNYGDTGFPDPTGASISFDLPPATSTPTINSNAANWSASASGVNGAFQSANNDWGSPGVVAIPEPTTVALFGLAVGVIAMLRRRC